MIAEPAEQADAEDVLNPLDAVGLNVVGRLRVAPCWELPVWQRASRVAARDSNLGGGETHKFLPHHFCNVLLVVKLHSSSPKHAACLPRAQTVCAPSPQGGFHRGNLVGVVGQERRTGPVPGAGQVWVI